MIQENELITFLVGTGVALFVVINWRRISRIPGSNWIRLSFWALYTGWALTLIEGFILPEVTNFLEHACYMVSSLAAATWCWLILIVKGRAR